MAHPEVALHPIHGPDGSTALPKGHPMHRDGDEKLPSGWDREFVDEMVAGGFAAKPNSAADKAITAERIAAGTLAWNTEDWTEKESAQGFQDHPTPKPKPKQQSTSATTARPRRTS